MEICTLKVKSGNRSVLEFEEGVQNVCFDIIEMP